MREILFRGKGDSKYNDGSWQYGYLCIDKDGDYQIRGSCWSRTVLPETVGQYTGLEDINGKKIFEGDIVLGVGGLPWLIAFELNAFVAKDYSMEIYFSLAEQWDYNWEDKKYIQPSDKFEVIGNIYDDPELLTIYKDIRFKEA